MSKTSKQQRGIWGERAAQAFLVQKNYQVVAQNFRTRFGEIDVIAWHGKPHFGSTLCFIEVKTRDTDDGSAERATVGKKLTRIMSAARLYCMRHDIDMEKTPIQFEQVSVYAADGAPVCRHLIIPVS